MALLCTGFEPSGDRGTDPSGELADRLDGRPVAGDRVVGETLPAEIGAAGDRMRELLSEHDPAAVVATGPAADRAAVAVERVGVNVVDAGASDERIDPDGADAYLATLPVRATVEACLDAGVPAHISDTAGTHLGNDLLYETLAALEGCEGPVPAGLLRPPTTPEAAARAAREAGDGSVRPSLPLDLSVRAVELALETAVGD